MTTPHPDTDTLALWLTGDLDERAGRDVEAHVETCGRCSSTAEDLAVDLARITEHAAPLAVSRAGTSTTWRWVGRAAAAVLLFASGMFVQARLDGEGDAAPTLPPVRDATTERTPADMAPLARSVSSHSNGLARGLAALRTLTRD